MRRLLPPLAVVGLLVVTAAAALAAWDAERESAARDERALAQQASTEARRAVDAEADRLRSAQGLLTPAGVLRIAGFRRFGRLVLNDGAFEAVAWLPLIRSAGRRRYERALGRPITEADGRGGLDPAGPRPFYLPVDLAQPPQSIAQGQRGFDVLSDPIRADAALAARDAGEAKLTPPTSSPASDAVAVTLLQPLYAPGRPIRTLGGRRAALRGMVGGLVPSDRLERAVRAELPGGIDLRVSDGDEVLFGPTDAEDDGDEVTTIVAGREWSVWTDGPAGPSAIAPLAIAAGGLALAAAIAMLFVGAAGRERTLDRRRASAERAASREALLVRVGDRLERPTDVEGRLDELARSIVPRLADVCVADLRSTDGRHRHTAVAASDPALEARLREQAGADGTEDDADAVALGLDATMRVPLLVRGRELGWLLLGRAHGPGRRGFDNDDRALAREVGARAALALDNARLYEDQREVARTLQRALLPPGLPSPPGLEVAARYRPGYEEREVGGDFYDLFEVEDGWIAAVGDVCGKGAEAAALTGLVRHTLRATAHGRDAGEVLDSINEAVRRQTSEGMFCTAVCARLQPGEGADGFHVRVQACTAGHPEPLLLRADGAIERLPPTGPLLGVLADARFGVIESELEPGETMVLFTDGIVEARGEAGLFGDARLEELAASADGASLDQLLDRIEQAVVEFSGGDPQDDLAILAIRCMRSRGV